MLLILAEVGREFPLGPLFFSFFLGFSSPVEMMERGVFSSGNNLKNSFRIPQY